jgi:4-amino-4-deoxy-L-arabinose transferase-like glycosyltransferase
MSREFSAYLKVFSATTAGQGHSSGGANTQHREPDQGSTKRHRPHLAAIAVFVLALGAFLPWIGAQEIWSKDEARTALVVKEMLRTGDWSLPRVPGGEYSRKPPLYHWLSALAARRGLDEATLRLPAAVAAAGTAALTYLIGAQLASPAVGIVAAAVLVASPSFFEWARVGRMESLLVFCVTLSVWGLGRWLQLGGGGNGLVFGAGVGLGVLTKGPPGLLPLAVAAVALAAWRARPGTARELAPGLALALAVPLGWLVPAALAVPDFSRYAWSLGPTLAGELAVDPGAPVEIAAGVAGGFLPWTLLLPGALVLLARQWPLSSPLIVMCLGWATVVLSVFGLALSARTVYFLPAYPALALLVAWAWQAAEGRQRRWLAVPLGLGIAAVIAAAMAIAFWPVTLRFHDDPLRMSSRIGLIGGGLLLLVGVVAFQLARRRRSAWALGILAVGAVVILLTTDVGMRTPFYNSLYPIRATVKRLEARIPPGTEVGYTESKRVTALAVYLARPLRQLPPPVKHRPLPLPAPPYVLLPEVEFDVAREAWSLHLVDEVLLHDVRYVLAKADVDSARSPR